MKLFDLHCDTITECRLKNRRLFKNNGHLSICKAEYLDRWIQVFAVWMPDEHRGDEAMKYFDDIYDCFKSEMTDNSLYIKPCVTIDDIENCFSQGIGAAILAVEGGSALAGSLEQLDDLHTFGVKLITLTWNAKNELASGCLVKNGGGLTPFGKQALKRMNDLKIIADVSHLNRQSFWDVAKSADAPFVASHSTCCAVLEKTRAPSDDKYFSMLRSLDDEQIKFIIANGGLIGINFCNSFLGDPGDDGFEAVYRHMSHILDMGGENVLAVGSDFDGCDINPELNGVDKMPALCDYLTLRGIPGNLIENIFFDNSFNFFKSMI